MSARNLLEGESILAVEQFSKEDLQTIFLEASCMSDAVNIFGGLNSFSIISLAGLNSILSSKNIARKKTIINKIVFIIKLLFKGPLPLLGCNLSCIINKLYLNSQIKTKL